MADFGSNLKPSLLADLVDGGPTQKKQATAQPQRGSDTPRMGGLSSLMDQRGSSFKYPKPAEQPGLLAEAAHVAYRGANAMGRFVNNTASGLWQSLPPVAAYEAVQHPERPTGLLESIIEQHDPTGAFKAVREDTGTGGKIARGIMGGIDAIHQWGAMGEAAKATEFMTAPVIDGISPALRTAVMKSGLGARLGMTAEPAGAKLAQVLSGEAEASAGEVARLGTRAAIGSKARQAAGAAITGGVVGAGVGAANKVAGQDPNWSGNIAAGAMMGLLTGAFSDPVKAKIAQKMDTLHSSLNAADKASVHTLNQVGSIFMKEQKYGPFEAQKRLKAIFNNEATETDRIVLRDIFQKHPELARSKVGAQLALMSRDYATPRVFSNPDLADDSPIKVTYEDANRNVRRVTVTRTQLRRYDNLASKGDIRINEVEGPSSAVDRYKQTPQVRRGPALNIPSEAEVNNLLTTMESGNYIDGLWQGREGVVPRWSDDPSTTYGKDFTMRPDADPARVAFTRFQQKLKEARLSPADYKTYAGMMTNMMEDRRNKIGETVTPITNGTTNGPTAVAAGVEVPGGRIVQLDNIEGVLPQGQRPENAPNIPQTNQPKEINPLQAELLTHAKGQDYTKLDKRLNSPRALKEFDGLIKSGTIKPSDITHPDVARTISGFLRDKMESVDENTPEFNQTVENAVAFEKRIFELKNEEPPVTGLTANLVLREPASGDIVRVVPQDAETRLIVDKNGNSVKVKSNQVPPNKITDLTTVANDVYKKMYGRDLPEGWRVEFRKTKGENLGETFYERKTVELNPPDPKQPHPLGVLAHELVHVKGRQRHGAGFSLEESEGLEKLGVKSSQPFDVERVLGGKGFNALPMRAADFEGQEALAKSIEGIWAEQAKQVESVFDNPIQIVKNNDVRGGMPSVEEHASLEDRAENAVKLIKLAIAEPKYREVARAAVLGPKLSEAEFAQYRRLLFKMVRANAGHAESQAAINEIAASMAQEEAGQFKPVTEQELRESAQPPQKKNWLEQKRAAEGELKGLESSVSKLKKMMKGVSKGSITVNRGTEIRKGGIADAVRKLGGRLYEVPEGYVVDGPAGQQLFRTMGEVAGYTQQHATNQRIVAEQNQVIASDALSVPFTQEDVRQLSPMLDAVDRLSKGESSIPGTKISYGKWGPPQDVRMQKSVLRSMGPGGTKLASMADMYWSTREMQDHQDMQAIYTATTEIKKLGGTVRGIENRTAHSKAIELYTKHILPILDRQHRDAQALGIGAESVVGKTYVPHVFDVQAADVSPTLIEEMRKRGLANSAEEVARVLNDPERYVNPTTQMTDPKAKSTMLETIQWLREKAAATAGTLEKERKGSNNYIDDLPKVLDRAIRMRNRRLAEASVFGPNLERIDGAIAEISGNSSFPSNTSRKALHIMNDVRGRVFDNTIGTTQTIAMDAARGLLTLSAPRHLIQAGMLAARYGFTKAAMGALHLMVHPLADSRMAREFGAALDTTRFDLSEDDILTKQTSQPVKVLGKFAQAWGKAGSWGLHATINTIRKVAFNVGTANFEKIMPKALAGDANALAELSDVLKFKVDPQMLSQADRTTLSRLYAKGVADWTGFTFRPQDMPGFARSGLGRALAQFRGYMWQGTATWFNLLTNPNISRSIRAKQALRLLAILPTVSLMDAKLRHKMGAQTVNGEEALAAYERLTKHPGLRNAINLELETAINSHMLGLASDFAQGVNTLDPNIALRSLALSPSQLAIPTDLAFAAANAYSYHQTGDTKERDAAYNSLSSVGAGLGLSVYRKRAGKTKNIRLPKHNIVGGY